MTTFIFIIYGFFCLGVIKLLSVTLQGTLTSEDAWFFGFLVIPLTVILGVLTVIGTLLKKKYTSELVFELVSLLLFFIIFTPLTSFALLARKHVQSDELYNITFSVYGFVAFIPGIIKINLMVKDYTVAPPITFKESLFNTIALFVLILISMSLVSSH
jgi:hypothetical protein